MSERYWLLMTLTLLPAVFGYVAGAFELGVIGSLALHSVVLTAHASVMRGDIQQ